MNNFSLIVRLVSMTAVPVLMTVLLKVLQKHWTAFNNCKVSVKNILVGVLFGLCAIFGTEFGVDTGTAIVNTRDASVLCAGLFFGGPAAGIAAVIGAVERFLAAYRGVGVYSKWACTIGTLLAGVIATLVRYFFFKCKNPKWHQSLTVAVFTEVVHLLLIFITHANDTYNAFVIIKNCSGYMIVMNGLSVLLATIVVALLEGESLFKSNSRELNTQFDIGLFVAMLIGFTFSIIFTSALENQLYKLDTQSVLDSAISDVEREIVFISDYSELEQTQILSEATKFKSIYTQGWVSIVDENYTFVSDRFGNAGKSIADFGVDLSGKENKLINVEFMGKNYVYSFRHVNTYFIIAVALESEARISCELSMYIVFFMEMIIFVLLFAIVFYLIRILVLQNLSKVNEGLLEITNGNLDTVINVNGNAEFEALSKGINSTVSQLKNLIDEANKRIDKELEIAKQIQISSIPTVFPKHRDGEIYALMDAAKEVGGDFYDFFFVEPHNLFIVIADVSGKGIPAALCMMRAKTLVKNFARQTKSDDVGYIFTEVNSSLCESNDADMFVTCWMGCVDLKTGHVKYANAGHNNPVIIKAGKKPVFLEEKVDFVLAGMDGYKYKTQEFDLEKDDTLYLYTDGFTEATNNQLELFGDDRLLEALSSADNNPEHICKIVKDAADSFTGSAPQFDDMTELAFTFRKD